MGMFNREDNLRDMGADPWGIRPDPEPKPPGFDWWPWVVGAILTAIFVVVWIALAGVFR